MFALKMPAIIAGYVLRTAFTFSCCVWVGNGKASPNSISSCHSIALTKPFLSQQHSLIYFRKSKLNLCFFEKIFARFSYVPEIAGATVFKKGKNMVIFLTVLL